MFIVCEPISWGLEHVPFNAAFLKTIHLAYPNEKICFYGEHSHIENVKKEVGDEIASLVQWEDIKLPHRHSSFLSRLSHDFKIIKFLLDKLRDNHSNDVLVITGNPSILWALKYYIFTSHKNKKIQVVIHGDFSKLRYRASLKHHLNPFYHIGTLNTALRLASDKRIQYIVLEEAIRDAVVGYMPFLQNNVKVLDHPVPINECNTVEVNELRVPIQFGFLGRVTDQKGFGKFLEVASYISRQLPGKANFHVIGRYIENMGCADMKGMEYLSTKPSNTILSREEYIEKLSKLHYVCFFYDKYYEFCASGALLDSVALEKPIVATRLSVFENLASRYGDIGYVCDKDGLINVINSIIHQNNFIRYQQQVLNMKNIGSARRPESLSKMYRELVENL